MLYSLVLKGGTLLDAAEGIHAVKDVAFAHGKVAMIDDSVPPSDAGEVVDCSGCLVAPGMIDLHVHVFWGISRYGIEADRFCVAKGVTTAVDAGSSGADTFPGFHRYVIELSRTRLFAQLNISSLGMLSTEIGELDNLGYASVSKAVSTIEQYRELILGVKVRLTKNQCVSEAGGIRPLYLAREVADKAGVPVMVHPQAAWCDSIDDILAVMRKGDILTHCFHGKECGILDGYGQIRESVTEAVERGVIFDVGHGMSSFTWKVSEQALHQGFSPQTISSDLHTYSVNGPVYDLATTCSKFLCLGLSLDEVLRKVTMIPAMALRLSDKIGTLKLGAWGDAVVFELQEGDFEFCDGDGQVRIGNQRLVPKMVVKAGKLHREKEEPADR